MKKVELLTVIEGLLELIERMEHWYTQELGEPEYGAEDILEVKRARRLLEKYKQGEGKLVWKGQAVTKHDHFHNTGEPLTCFGIEGKLDAEFWIDEHHGKDGQRVRIRVEPE